MTYKITQAKMFTNKEKGFSYVFLLSVFEGSAYWSVHPYAGEHVSVFQYACMFQKQHDFQVEAFRIEADKHESDEHRIISIDDHTQTPMP